MVTIFISNVIDFDYQDTIQEFISVCVFYFVYFIHVQMLAKH